MVSGFGLSQLDLLAITFTKNPVLIGSPGSSAANAWHSYLPSFPNVLSSSCVIFRKCKVTNSFFNFFPPEKVYGVFQLLNKRSLTSCHSVREPPFAFFLIEKTKRGFCLNRVKPCWSRCSPNFWTSQSCFLSSS